MVLWIDRIGYPQGKYFVRFAYIMQSLQVEAGTLHKNSCLIIRGSRYNCKHLKLINDLPTSHIARCYILSTHPEKFLTNCTPFDHSGSWKTLEVGGSWLPLAAAFIVQMQVFSLFYWDLPSRRLTKGKWVKRGSLAFPKVIFVTSEIKNAGR